MRYELRSRPRDRDRLVVNRTTLETDVRWVAFICWDITRPRHTTVVVSSPSDAACDMGLRLPRPGAPASSRSSSGPSRDARVRAKPNGTPVTPHERGPSL